VYLIVEKYVGSLWHRDDLQWHLHLPPQILQN